MNTQEIKQQLKENDPDKLYRVLINCGKRYALSPKEKEELKSVIYDLCSHPDTEIRRIAIYVLCFYWGMEEYRDKAWKMYSNEKELSAVRTTALSSWANTYRNKNLKKAMNILYSILKNKNNDEYIRVTAYSSILVISSLQPKDWPNTDIDWDHFDKEVDWKLVEKLMTEAQ
ncbi:hypothetical protein [uncultured Chryseobacterium sp.]|uniref:hypothetical protein n=1 Tax=uncultured Chryseobacterium sp. TaxID=259322 RepID=UPI0025E74505|nr:hypothetical protein [uncultured Chryseobacterium sp.]